MRHLLVTGLFALAVCAGCGGGGGAGGSAAPQVAVSTPSPSPAPSASAASLGSVYAQAQWGTAVTLTFSGSCSMTLHTTGVPAYHNAYYLAPAGGGQTVVATSPVTHTQLAVIPYAGSNLYATSQTFNVCPSKAASTTATGGGPIGYAITGEAIFNANEINGTPALSDNASYSFTDGSGTQQTAYFIDTCNSHSTINQSGQVQWHFHGVPACITSTLDGATGPSHILGVALDGYPIYGGRDINGNVIATSQLDACNGITSPTPEFPNGIYHYVLPIGVTGSQSSIGCFAGVVSQQIARRARTPYCGHPPTDVEVVVARRVQRRV